MAVATLNAAQLVIAAKFAAGDYGNATDAGTLVKWEKLMNEAADDIGGGGNSPCFLMSSGGIRFHSGGARLDVKTAAHCISVLTQKEAFDEILIANIDGAESREAKTGRDKEDGTSGDSFSAISLGDLKIGYSDKQLKTVREYAAALPPSKAAKAAKAAK